MKKCLRKLRNIVRGIRNLNITGKNMLSAVAMILVFTIVYAMIMPAIALERNEASNMAGVDLAVQGSLHGNGQSTREYACSLGAHKHTDNCYTDEPVYDETGKQTGTNRELICGKADWVVHTHDESCYIDGELVCDLPEHAEHIHTDACYSTKKVLTCGMEEGEDHTHTDECYTEERVLTCGESALHTHTVDCYEKGPDGESPVDMGWVTIETDEDGNQVISGDPNHLVCGLLELRAHQHTEDCYRITAKSYEITDQDAGKGDGQSEEQSEAAEVEDEVSEENTEDEQTDSLFTKSESEFVKHIITARGKDYLITVSYGEETDIPADAFLKVEVITQSDTNYESYVEQTEEALDWETGSAANVRLFDIQIVDPENPSDSCQPAEGTAVDVKIEFPEEEKEDWNIVHFGDEPEVVDSTTEENAVSFEAEGFSVYAIVSSGATTNLGEKSYAIINTNLTTKEAVMNGTQNNGTRLTAAGVSTQNIDGKDYVIGDNIAYWTFTHVNGNSYYIQDQNGKYININGLENVSLSDTPQAISANTANGRAGQVRLSANGYALNAWNRRVSDGITGGYWGENEEYFTLYELNQIISYRAEKISLSDLVAKRLSGNPIQDVVIYTRIENEAKDGYDVYAVSKDGTLIKIHDIGDTVGWTTQEASGDSLKWKFTVHESGGEPNSYFDFQNTENGLYLLPTPTGIMKEDDPSDTRDLGVNLRGWDNKTYGSPIERWDTATHSYVGYSYNSTTMKLEPYTGAAGQKELEFFYAQIPDGSSSTPVTPAGLHTVETLDGKTKGITIKMYDFDGNSLFQNWPPRSREMTNVLGAGSISSTNDNGVGYANRGLVSTTLGTNGFPTATQTNKSLEELFNDGHLKSDASNLFVRKEYDETGYFTYDSSINYAYLDQNQKKYILYREVAAPEMEQGTTPSGQKGNFFPFNSLEELKNNNSVFDNRTVQYDGDLQKLPVSHPQYGDTLYKIPKGESSNGYASYFFGMTMEAEFYQGPGGKDEKGEDTIFTFNGDDDMWLYIDGLLALDIGGCHGAVSGTINFATGDVKVGGARPYSTTIRKLFEDAHILPNGNPWNETDAAKFFSGNTFADYTQHSFKMIYLERGAYASNLKVSFNLRTIEPGTFVLEKKLPENVQSSYGDALFAYQIFTVENGQKTLYTPPTDRYVTYEGTGARVVPEGATESIGFKPSYTLNGQTYKNVYFLEPDQAIVIPVTDKSVRYYVREIGIHTDVYEKVKVNEEEVPITKTDNVVGEAENLDPTSIAATSVSSVQDRGRVTYENIPKEDHVHNLRLEKVIDSPVKDPDATFRFDVLLENNENDQLVPYNQGEYYLVKTNENGQDQYYKYENGKPVPSDVPVVYKAGVSGSISNIPEGYTILIKGLLSGTDFKVTENLRPNEMPEGYMYVKTEVKHAADPDQHLQESQGQIRVYSDQGEVDHEDARVIITNRPTGKLVVEKEWESGDFVTTHGDIYVALYEKSGSGEEVTYTLVQDSLRKLELDTTANKYRTEYYLPGPNFGKYEAREVIVTKDQEGNVTDITPVENGKSITIPGETTIETVAGETANDSYIVQYAQGEEEEYSLPSGSVSASASQTGKMRTDTIKNILPKISLYKTNENTTTGKKYLANAVFALEDQNGNAVKDASGKAITFTSDTDGKLFADKYFSDGTYYLRETTAPAGYILLENRIVLTVNKGAISAKMESPGTTIYQDQSGDDATIYRFEIQNNPGYELPSTGGPGTKIYMILGGVLVLTAGLLVLRRRRQ